MGRRRRRSHHQHLRRQQLDVAQIYKLIPRAEYDKLRSETTRASEQGYFAHGRRTRMASSSQTFLNPLGMPCWNGPYGTLSSYDLNTGKLNWRKPFGEIQKWGFYMPNSWGSVTIGSPGDHQDRRDLHRRLDGFARAGDRPQDRQGALDSRSSKLPAVAMPAVYTYKGKEYVVFAVGGNSILEPKVATSSSPTHCPVDIVSQAFVRESGGSPLIRSSRESAENAAEVYRVIERDFDFAVRDGRGGWTWSRGSRRTEPSSPGSRSS